MMTQAGNLLNGMWREVANSIQASGGSVILATAIRHRVCCPLYALPLCPVVPSSTRSQSPTSSCHPSPNTFSIRLASKIDLQITLRMGL